MTISNPLIQKKMTNAEKEDLHSKIRFDNMQRPYSGYQRDFVMPFSTNQGGETLMHKRKELHHKIINLEAARMAH